MSQNCYYHKGQKLTNFCFNKQCSLPLCPKCIHDHLSTPANHHIISLDTMLANTREYLATSIEGLQAQSRTLMDQFHPQIIHKQFSELIQKYRQENIQQINIYYKNLAKQLFLAIQNTYTQHLLIYEGQLKEKLKLFTKYNQDIHRDQSLIPAIININCNDEFNKFEQLFSAYLTKKTNFKSYLPVVDLSDKGRLEIKAQKITHVARKDNNQNLRQNYRDPLERILNLEDKLYLVRSRIMQ